MTQPIASTDLLLSYAPRLLLTRLQQSATPPPEQFTAVLLMADISGFTAPSEPLAEQGSGGAEQLTAAAGGYLDESQTVPVAAGQTIRQDFGLAPFIWRGLEDSNWNNPQNWAGGLVPGGGDNVTLDPSYLAGVMAWPVWEVDPTLSRCAAVSTSRRPIRSRRPFAFTTYQVRPTATRKAASASIVGAAPVGNWKRVLAPTAVVRIRVGRR
jgi:hypothetical protein